jgi:hypothetical protein
MAEEYTKDELAKWFESKAFQTGSQAARRKILNADDRHRDETFAGKLYFYRYDAKTKDKLDMWDKYPLCMVLEKTSNGFLGLNLHYLSKGQRKTLLRVFDKYAKDYDIESGTTTGHGVGNWELLIKSINGTGAAALPKKCLKRYLFTHVRSKFVEIYPDEYDKAIQLPIDLWVYKR